MLKALKNILFLFFTLLICSCINQIKITIKHSPSKIASAPSNIVDISKIASDYRSKSPRNARSYHTATLLTSGKVLIVGGDDDSGYLNSVELYDPETKLFTSTGSLDEARYNHTATLLTSGKVLIVGGEGERGYLNSVELYDQETKLFTSSGSLTDARNSHTATLLNSGKVLIHAGAGAMIFWEILSFD